MALERALKINYFPLYSIPLYSLDPLYCLDLPTIPLYFLDLFLHNIILGGEYSDVINENVKNCLILVLIGDTTWGY